MEGNDRRHHTILTEGEEPVPLQSADSPFDQCPFCSYKTAERHSVINHIQNHATVKHKEFTSARCGLKCHSTTHFHCCYCPATLIRRDQITKHLSSHSVLDNTITGTLQTLVAPQTIKTPQGNLQTPVAPPKVKTPQGNLQTPVAPPKVKTPQGNLQTPVAPPKVKTPQGNLQTPVAPPKVKTPVAVETLQAREAIAQPPPFAHAKKPTDLPLAWQHKKETLLNRLVPAEVTCKECVEQSVLSDPQLITSKARILTCSGIVEGISTYKKTCPSCGMVYRYQEWQDGIHNFDNHMMLSLHLCLTLRNALQTHTAVSRVIGIIEATEGESLPNKEKVLQAYLSFEALSEHDYTYACVSCGYHPATVVMDLHKKGVFSMPVSEIQNPPQQYDGRINVKDFWDAVTMEILNRGFYPSDGKNPFIVRPSYQNWAPWIGQHTRQSDIVFNTEYAKIHVPDVSTDADERVTEERLADEVLNLKVAEVRALCKQCGLHSKGSKMDLVLRLREKMASRTTYNKVFEKVWGASG
ncbi:hypothetical protein KUCAC02_005504 [Chaenocephalus aceratus]|uniref:Uncharacterized protein n=1 Tax=Chaenocephalus aceratus TaxID=36190 RepID=A0ACB9WPN9_CHAAC|nr:hypothetical protein KUCAC02_005504 [Chaenocephalus aceratus]